MNRTHQIYCWYHTNTNNAFLQNDATCYDQWHYFIVLPTSWLDSISKINFIIQVIKVISTCLRCPFYIGSFVFISENGTSHHSITKVQYGKGEHLLFFILCLVYSPKCTVYLSIAPLHMQGTDLNRVINKTILSFLRVNLNQN